MNEVKYCPKCGSENIEVERDDGKVTPNEGVTMIADDTGDSVQYYAEAALTMCNDCEDDTIIGKT